MVFKAEKLLFELFLSNWIIQLCFLSWSLPLAGAISEVKVFCGGSDDYIRYIATSTATLNFQYIFTNFTWYNGMCLCWKFAATMASQSSRTKKQMRMWRNESHETNQQKKFGAFEIETIFEYKTNLRNTYRELCVFGWRNAWIVCIWFYF